MRNWPILLLELPAAPAAAVMRRIQVLRRNLSQLLSAAPPAAPVAADFGPAGELHLLTGELDRSLYRGRERESQMRRSVELLEYAQAAGGIGTFNLDLVTGKLTGTPLLFELLGLADPRAPFTRDDWLVTVHPEDLEAVIGAFNSAISVAGKFKFDYRTLRENHEPKWLACCGDVLLDAEGLPACAIGTLSDVTPRKLLEESLQQATRSLNIAQAVAGVATLDLDFGRGRCVASDNFHELLGLRRCIRLDDLEGHLAAVHPEDRERVRNAPFGIAPGAAVPHAATRGAATATAAAAATEQSFTCEYRVLLEADTVRWIAQTMRVSRGRHGELLRLTGALVDVTVLKAAQDALHA